MPTGSSECLAETEAMIGRSVVLDETVNIGQNWSRFCRITVANQPKVDMTGIDRVDPCQNGDWWCEADPRVSVQPS